MAYSSTLKMEVTCSPEDVTQKEGRTWEVLWDEDYKNGNVKGRNMFKNAYRGEHTGECKGR
jgi:hypothetical protein